MFGVWCLVFGVWCLVFGVWCLVLNGLPALGELSFVAGGPALLPAAGGSGSGRAESGVGGFIDDGVEISAM